MKTTHFITLLLIAVFVAVTSGCNTVRGVGKDVEAAGGAIQKSTR